jgi:hypothetical protein
MPCRRVTASACIHAIKIQPPFAARGARGRFMAGRLLCLKMTMSTKNGLDFFDRL